MGLSFLGGFAPRSTEWSHHKIRKVESYMIKKVGSFNNIGEVGIFYLVDSRNV